MPALKNPRHEAFAQFYAKGKHGGNATASYKAVFGKNNRAQASRLQHRRDIAQRVAEIVAQAHAIEAEETRKTIEAVGVPWIVDRLIEIAERCMQHQAVLDEEGEPIGEYKFDAAGANKALELLGKHHGMFLGAGGDTINNILNLGNVQLIDRPPIETFKQWQARRLLELKPATNGKGH